VFIYGGGFAKKAATILFTYSALQTNADDTLIIQAMETKIFELWPRE